MHNFLNFKLQQCDAWQNGVEFYHKAIVIGDDVKRPPFYFSYPCPSTVNEAIILGYTL